MVTLNVKIEETHMGLKEDWSERRTVAKYFYFWVDKKVSHRSTQTLTLHSLSSVYRQHRNDGRAS